MTVPLVESTGAVGSADQPQVTTMGGPAVYPSAPGSSTRRQSSASGESSVDFQPGGRETDPIIRIGETRLGYEDVLLLVALVQVVATTVRLWMEVTD